MKLRISPEEIEASKQYNRARAVGNIEQSRTARRKEEVAEPTSWKRVPHSHWRPRKEFYRVPRRLARRLIKLFEWMLFQDAGIVFASATKKRKTLQPTHQKKANTKPVR